jgi:hypothetical protein
MRYRLLKKSIRILFLCIVRATSLKEFNKSWALLDHLLLSMYGGWIANTTAHTLARDAVINVIDLIWLDDIPSSIFDIVLKELVVLDPDFLDHLYSSFQL